MRKVTISNATSKNGKDATVKVTLNSQGDEVALSFTLQFDPAELAYKGIVLGSGVPSGATLTANVHRISEGLVAVLVDAATVFAAKKDEVVTFKFTPLVSSGKAHLLLNGAIVPLSISDAVGNLLLAKWIDGGVTIK